MIMSLAKKIFYNSYVFRCVYLFYLIGEASHILDIDGHDFIELLPINFLFLWGCFLLVRDIAGRRMFLEMKNVWLLIAFLGLAGITSLVYLRYTEDNYIAYFHQVIFFLVFLPPDKTISRQDLYKAIFAFFNIFIVFITFMVVVTLFSFLTEREIVINTTAAIKLDGFGRDSRFQMFMFGPNPTGLVTFVTIASILICQSLIKHVITNRYFMITWKIISILFIPLNTVMLILSDTRGAVFALMLFVLLFSFLAIYRLLCNKVSIPKSCIAAVLAAILFAGLVYQLDRPMRMGFAVIRAAAAQTAVQTGSETIGQPTTELLATNDASPDVSDFYIEGRSDREYTDNIFAGREGLIDSTAERLNIWRLGYELVKMHPLLGSSHGGFRSVASDYLGIEIGEVSRDESKLISNVPSHMHNAFIQLAVTNGISALVLLLLFLCLYAKHNIAALIKASHSSIFLPAGAILALCAAITLYNMYQSVLFPMHNGDVSTIFWVSLGFAATLLQYHSTTEVT